MAAGFAAGPFAAGAVGLFAAGAVKLFAAGAGEPFEAGAAEPFALFSGTSDSEYDSHEPSSLALL